MGTTPYAGSAFGGSLHLFTVFRMPVSIYTWMQVDVERQKEKEREREREKSKNSIHKAALPSPFTAPAILFLDLFTCGIHRLENDTKGAPTHLDISLIKQWYRFGIALCKAEIAKPKNIP